MDQGAEAVQLPRPTLSAEARGPAAQLRMPSIYETRSDPRRFSYGIRFAGSGGRQFKPNDAYAPFIALYPLCKHRCRASARVVRDTVAR